jgi:hypothetical protein
MEAEVMKRGTPDHPKVYALAEKLGIRRPTALGHLELLFHFAAQYAPQGDVGRFPDKRIAAGMDWAGKAEKLIESLVATGWLDRDSHARLVVHDWHDHADRTRLQRLSRNGKSPIHADHQVAAEVCTQSELKIRTLPEPEPEPEPEPIAIAHPRPRRRDGTPPPGTDPFSSSDLAEKLYTAHPNKAGRVLFQQALAAKLAGAVDPLALAERIRRSHAAWLPMWNRDGARFAPRLDRWVAEDRFLDDAPSEAGPGPVPALAGSSVEDEQIPAGIALPAFGDRA